MGRRLHDLRHTAACLWLVRGVDLSTASAWLGHASITTTNRYLHYLGTAADSAGLERLNRGRCARSGLSRPYFSVDMGGLKPNTWQLFERLSSAWNQAKLVLRDEPDGAADDEPGVVANPRRRARTPLTESQVDAIRTARANGESVVSICRRFNVHRMTVWTQTRDLL